MSRRIVRTTRLRSHKKLVKSHFLSGEIKKLIVAFFLGILMATMTITTFFLVKNGIGRYSSQNKTTKVLRPDYDSKATKKPDFLLTPTPHEASKGATIATKIKLPIIMYHYIEYVADPKDTIRMSLDITPATFEYQLSTLKQQNIETYFVRDIPDIVRGKIQKAPHSVVLTFDDGYEDFYTDALPLLKKYQMKATLYVIYDFIGRKGFLSVKQLHEIAESGLVEIGSHTLDHLYLSQMPYTVAKEQIFESKKHLEDLLGQKVETFAYPFGAFNQDDLELAKQAGYTAAVSVIPGNEHSTDTLFYLYRVRAGGYVGPRMVDLLERDFQNE